MENVLLNFFKDYLNFLIDPKYWEIALAFIVVGVLPVLATLLFTKHAVPGSKNPEKRRFVAACWDSRLSKAVGVLGGSNAFTFGLLWYGLGHLGSDGGWWQMVMYGAAKEGAALSVVSIPMLLIALWMAPRGSLHSFVYFLCAHLFGCGYDTASAGPVFILFWTQKLAETDALSDTIVGAIIWFVGLFIRDGLVLVNWIVSIPFVLMLNVVTVPLTFHVVLPGIPLWPDLLDKHGKLENIHA